MPRKNRTNLFENKLVISQEVVHKSRNQSQLERKIRNDWVLSQSENGEEICQKDQEEVVFTQIAQLKSWKLGAPEEATIREYVYDKSLMGLKDTELLNNLCFDLGLNADEYGRIAKVKACTKVGNMARIPREFNAMLVTDDVNVVANRLRKFLSVFEEREGGVEALRRAGISVREVREGHEE